MFVRFRKKLILLALILEIALIGCFGAPTPGPTPTGPEGEGPIAGDPNPAGPPAPPAELPSALRIPEDLSINVDKTRSESGISALAALVGSGGEFSEQIAFGPNLVFFANGRLNGLLAPLHPIEIPVSASLTEMDTFLAIGTTIYAVHLDFADFDLNGDGTDEGCSGHTAALPICMRVWIDNGTEVFRLLAARFDAFPTDLNPGAGSLRGKDLSFSGPGGPFQVAADYNHVDPEDKFTDSFFGYLDESDPNNPVVPFSIRAFASQLGPDDTALKTTNGNNFCEETPGDASCGRALGRWLEDDDFWSGSFETDDPDPSLPEEISNQCAQISTGNAANPSDPSDRTECLNRGIDLELPPPLDFLDFTTAQDLLFFDFPAAP